MSEKVHTEEISKVAPLLNLATQEVLAVYPNNSQLVKDALISHLTDVSDHSVDIPNTSALPEQLALAAENGHKISADTFVIPLDVKGLLHVSTALGHEAGDLYIAIAVDRVAQCLSTKLDLVAICRVEGDEILLMGNDKPGLTPMTDTEINTLITKDQAEFFSQNYNRDVVGTTITSLHGLQRQNPKFTPGVKIEAYRLQELTLENLPDHLRAKEIASLLYHPEITRTIRPPIDDTPLPSFLESSLHRHRQHYETASPLSNLHQGIKDILSERYALSLIEIDRLDDTTRSLLEDAIFEGLYPRGTVYRMVLFEEIAKQLALSGKIRIRRAADVLLKDANSRSHLEGDEHLKKSAIALHEAYPDALIFQHHGSFLIVDQEPFDSAAEASPYTHIDLSKNETDDTAPYLVITNYIETARGKPVELLLSKDNVGKLTTENKLWEAVRILQEQHSFNELSSILS